MMKETTEAVIAVNELGILLCERLRDGFQVTQDLPEIFAKFSKDEEFLAKIKAGYQNAAAIPAEVGKIDLASAVDLVTVQISYIPKIIAALGKK